MGLINRKREDTSLTTIAMAVLVTNIFGSFKRAISETEMGGQGPSRKQYLATS